VQRLQECPSGAVRRGRLDVEGADQRAKEAIAAIWIGKGRVLSVQERPKKLDASRRAASLGRQTDATRATILGSWVRSCACFPHHKSHKGTRLLQRRVRSDEVLYSRHIRGMCATVAPCLQPFHMSTANLGKAYCDPTASSANSALLD
jgi:hypothetical protein